MTPLGETENASGSPVARGAFSSAEKKTKINGRVTVSGPAANRIRRYARKTHAFPNASNLLLCAASPFLDACFSDNNTT